MFNNDFYIRKFPIYSLNLLDMRDTESEDETSDEENRSRVSSLLNRVFGK